MVVSILCPEGLRGMYNDDDDNNDNEDDDNDDGNYYDNDGQENNIFKSNIFDCFIFSCRKCGNFVLGKPSKKNCKFYDNLSKGG